MANVAFTIESGSWQTKRAGSVPARHFFTRRLPPEPRPATPGAPLPLDEVDRRGARMALNLELRPEDMGRIVAIDVTTGEHYIGDKLLDLILKARAKDPRAQTYSFRAGGGGVYRFRR